MAWQDARPTAVGEDGTVGRRRTPSLLDAGHNETFFWDGRARSLEEQVLRPIEERGEMNRSPDSLIAWLSDSAAYRARFAAAFPGRMPAVSIAGVAEALAAFVRTLESGTSAFDRWAAGDTQALTPPARRGFEIFVGKGRCIACHTGWRLSDEAFYDIGLPLRAADPDRGRGPVIGVARADHAFRTPSLRDVALRPPYMHDGSLADLRAVVDHYADRVVQRPTLAGEVQPIALDGEERQALVAFLEALTTERPGDEAPASPLAATVAVPAARDATALARVSQRARRFSTSRVTLAHGGRLEILNDDTTTHNIQVFDPRLEFNSGAQEPGQTVRLGFATPGTYTVFCGIHPRMKLRVEAE